MRAPEIAPAFHEEAQWLYRACTGRACPPEIQVRYAEWADAQEAWVLPALVRKLPCLLAICEPLPRVCPQFDIRRAAILTLAESHPSSAPLYYQYRSIPWLASVCVLAGTVAVEMLKLPLRFFFGWWLWR